jgi:hypothetical protein
MSLHTASRKQGLLVPKRKKPEEEVVQEADKPG